MTIIAVLRAARDNPLATSDETGDSESLDDAFALLGNETRMAILRELWDEREPFVASAENALSFTGLRERVGADDPGRFNYHLNRLVDEFVTRTEEGYALRTDAIPVLRAAVIRSAIGDASLAPTPAEDDCPFCGGDVEVLYADGQLVVRCRNCLGEYESEHSPPGTLMGSQLFPPTGIGGRTGQEVWEAMANHTAAAAFSFLRGVCFECGAASTTSVSVCSDHAADGLCERCGSSQAAIVTVECTTCGAAWRGPAWTTAMTHPTVIAFLHDHGLDAVGGLTLDVYNVMLTAEETVRSVDPLRLEEAVELDGDELSVVVDDELSVVEVRV